MERAFTLLELIIVIIIVGILASIGFIQYSLLLEKSRSAEAMAILGTIRKANIAYKIQYGVYTGSISQLGVEVPASCTNNTHYFYYQIADLTNMKVRAEAYRCTSGGKNPSYSHSYALKLCIHNPGQYAIYYPEGVTAPFWPTTNWGCESSE